MIAPPDPGPTIIPADALMNLRRRQFQAPKAVRRADRGKPRKLPVDDLERYCEIVAALKVRTANKNGHHLSTVRAIPLMEEYGVETPDGLVKLAAGLLTKTAVNRYLLSWGYDEARMTREPPAVRFQAKRSNECWQFDMSPSDLKVSFQVFEMIEALQQVQDTLDKLAGLCPEEQDEPGGPRIESHG